MGIPGLRFLGSQDAYKWRFFRSGGFDQVRLETGADLMALDQLDPKLWSALACPSRELEFDARTLALIDTDEDGRIRVPEIIAAAKWAGSLLKNPDDLTRGAEALPLAAIDDSHPEGRQILASAREILRNLGKPDATAVTAEDTADTARIFAQTRFNGDGIVPARAADDAAGQAAIEDVMACFGSEIDRSGLPGVSREKVDLFFADAQAFSDWWAVAEADPAVLPLGQGTLVAAETLAAVRQKVDDYFARCRLSAFDSRAASALNPAEAEYAALSTRAPAAWEEAVLAFPLARVEPGRPLPLDEGLNPAWADAIARLRADVVAPLLGDRATLASEDWAAVKTRLAPYETWAAGKAGAAVEALGLPRVRELLAGSYRATIDSLIDRDLAVEAEANAITSVERLVLYHQHLFMLLNNFVSLRDFYTQKAKAVFQAGTLYLDGRSCELCVRVADTGKHAALAALARTYLAYCECTRKGSVEKMTIAAAFTGGDSDHLMVGRNGVFYDRAGKDWDAAIVKIVEHPISIRQAFWAPYKRIARMITEQIEKMAASRAKAVEEKAAAGIAEASQHVEGAKPPPAQPFDVGKFAGIFAAIGLAVGAIGTAVASVVTGFLGLRWWQMPLALVGLVLMISGPSVVMAWLKLRQRNLAPILDANGWAVNTQAKINIAFGGALTSVAKLPEGAERSLVDPFAEKKKPWWLYAGVALALLGALAFFWHRGHLHRLVGRTPAPASAPR